MGGGDLNLKKSWHPSTLRNIERVWKAEQKHEVEKQKIEQLQKELAEERAKEEIQAYAEDQGVVKKREERLDWMYQGPAAMVNREDYLLGRKVDKTLELLEQEETGVAPKSDDHDIGASMFSSQDLSGTETVDLANKIREDPLFSIRKNEKEQRKNLLCNPVKMKQLQQMLQKSLGKDKKKNKRSHDLDADRKHRKRHKKERRSSEDETRAQDHHHRNSKKFSSREDTPERYRAKEPSRRNGHHSSNGDRDGHPSYASRYANGHSSRKPSQSYSSKQNSEDRNKRRMMDDGERERRLREMQEDARRMEEERARKVRRYREDEKREEKAAHNRVDASDFIKPLLSKAAGKGSVENRVKQKVFSIQRSHGDMDRNFVRR